MISVEYSAAWIRERSRTNGCFFLSPPCGSYRSLGSQSSSRDARDTITLSRAAVRSEREGSAAGCPRTHTRLQFALQLLNERLFQ